MLPPRVSSLSRRGGHGREQDLECSAVPGFAAYFNGPVMSAHDTQDRRQPQSSSRKLRSEERVENLTPGLRVHPDAIVRHGEANVIALCQVAEIRPRGEQARIHRLSSRSDQNMPRLLS